MAANMWAVGGRWASRRLHFGDGPNEAAPEPRELIHLDPMPTHHRWGPMVQARSQQGHLPWFAPS